jgi:hypothetical protein
LFELREWWRLWRADGLGRGDQLGRSEGLGRNDQRQLGRGLERERRIEG